MKLADLGNLVGNEGSGSEPNADTRIAYGVGCTWWDSIYKTGTTTPGRMTVRRGDGTPVEVSDAQLPCCPHCGSMLFEVENEQVWFEGVDRYEQDGHPGYRKQMEWMRGKCFKDMAAAKAAYDAKEQPR